MITSPMSHAPGMSRRRTSAAAVVVLLTLVCLPALGGGAPTGVGPGPRAQVSAPASLQVTSWETDFPPCC